LWSAQIRIDRDRLTATVTGFRDRLTVAETGFGDRLTVAESRRAPAKLALAPAG